MSCHSDTEALFGLERRRGPGVYDDFHQKSRAAPSLGVKLQEVAQSSGTDAELWLQRLLLHLHFSSWTTKQTKLLYVLYSK